MPLIAAILIALLVFPAAAFAEKAGMVLYPTLLVLEEGQRHATISVFNSGDARGLYRIGIVDTEMTEKGVVAHLPEDALRTYSIKPLIKLSPRRMLLEPGQSQNIRILIRRPDDLPDHEFRSHLKVKLVEDNVDLQGQPILPEYSGKGFTLGPKARLVSAIPIFVRAEGLAATAHLSDPEVLEGDGPPTFSFNMHREGNMTIRGDLTVTHVNAKGRSKVVHFLPGVPVYYPSSHRNMTLQLELDSKDLEEGRLEIRYAAQGGKVLLAELVHPL
jgi:P pilus assembly chaperone PapD